MPRLYAFICYMFILLMHLAYNNIISSAQHGFIVQHSTCTNMLESLNDWTNTIEEHRELSIAYTDFSRAFDSVSVTKLLYKLCKVGIVDPLLSLIHTFLTNRQQRVVIGSSASKYTSVISGVPQGSVLGPILFIIYINDLPDFIGSSHVAKLFADDVKSYCHPNHDFSPALFQSGIDNICKWSELWQLKLSIEKCSCLHVCSKDDNNTRFNINCSILVSAKFCKDLGILVDDRLNFTAHIQSIVAKAKQRLYLLFKCFSSRQIDLLVKAYKSYILPILDYCSPVWSPYKLADIDLLESVQRFFTKRLEGLYDIPYADRLQKCGLCGLEMRRLHYDLLMCYQIMNGHVALKANDFFKLDTSCRTRGHTQKLKVPGLSKSNCRANFFAVRIVPVWNSLPQETIACDSVKSFRDKLKTIDPILSKHLKRPVFI